MSQVADNAPPLWELADAAFQQAMRRVNERARRSGTPVIVWRNEQIVRLSPDDPSIQPNGQIVLSKSAADSS